MWGAGSGKPTELPLPGWAVTGTALGIAEDGTVVGVVDNANPGNMKVRGYAWRADGSTRELPVPKGIRAQWVGAYGIHDAWVTGRALAIQGRSDPGRTVAVRWNLDTGESKVFPQLHEFYPRDNTNNEGWLVGSHKQGTALLITPAGDLSLPRLEGGRSLFRDVARTVSDDGRVITGKAFDDQDARHAVVWRCQ